MRAVIVALASLVLAQTLTKPPELVTGEPPPHPSEPAAALTTGASVTLAIVIDAAGRVARVDVVGVALDGTLAGTSAAPPGAGSSGLEPAFAWAALGAATGFVFLPAEVDGAAATVSVNQTLRFEPVLSTTTPDTTSDTKTPTTTTTTPTTTTATGRLLGRVRSQGTVIPLPADLRVSSNRRDEERRPGVDDEQVLHADEQGRFALTVAEGPWHLEVTTTGHEPNLIDVYVAAGAVEVLDVTLRPRDVNAFETVVRAARSAPPVSRVSLSRAEVTGIPGTYGDALRVIESLPGVARAPLLGGALMVRGGLPADTQVMIEGVPVPTLYHFGGFRSVVNGAFVEELSFMPGGFPARYGNATAGIVDITTHALTADPFEAKFSVDLLDVGFFFGGTAKLSDVGDLNLPDVRIGLAARRSHTEVPGYVALGAATAFGLPLSFLPVPSWYDWQFKLESDVTDDVTLMLFAFGAEDQFSFIGEPPGLGSGLPDDVDINDLVNSLLGNTFTRYVGRATWRPVRGVTHTFQPWIGQTRRGLLADGVVVPLLAGDFFSPPQEQLDWGLRDETRVRFTGWLELRAGLDAQQSSTVVQRLASPDTGDVTSGDAPLTQAFTSSAGVWADAVIELGALTVVPGVRGELSSIKLSDEEPLYDGSTTSIVDQLFVDPRVQLRYRFADLLTVKGAFGTFHQRPRLQSAAFDIDGDPLLHPQAVHLVAGLESTLSEDLTLDAQVYAVHRMDLTRDRNRTYVPGVSFAGGLPAAGSFDSFGRGDTQGFEFLLRTRPRQTSLGGFFGWVAYTFSRTVVSLGDRREPEVPSAFDQTHNLIAVGKVTLPYDITAGARFAFVTGNPGPIPDSVSTSHDLNDNFYTPVLSSLRPSRLPAFHRLDLRVERTWIFDWCRVTPFLEVINSYNWLNPEVLFPSGDYRQRELRVLLPGPPILPLMGLEMTL